ncbi:MAG: indolepyruvate oxidoreductase subunit beta [Promethearchaeota archaeon]
MSDGSSFDAVACGVGGQGVVLLSSVVGHACAELGLSVRTAETHGLAQRSGSIYVHLRVGTRVASPLIPRGTARVLVALEATEALRQLEYLRFGGLALVNRHVLVPVHETHQLVLNNGEGDRVGVDEALEGLRQWPAEVVDVDANALAAEVGNPRVANVVMLGALAAVPGFPIPLDELGKAVGRVVPRKSLEANLRALQLGNAAAADRVGQLDWKKQGEK